MCGLMYAGGRTCTFKKFKESFKKIRYRGPDMTRYAIWEDGLMGFHRLAIMGMQPEGMQPMLLKQNLCICNGEIYNYQELKSLCIHEFQSECDCEVLLPLYDRYGTKMFSMLDGEFAMVLYDDTKKEVIAARDAMGIRPLFYGYQANGRIAFASEAKALQELCEEITPFPIGSYYANGAFVKYHDYHSVEETVINRESDCYQRIRELLEEAVIKRLNSDAPLGFLLSGGLDSSLVCSIAAKHSDRPIRTFAVGMKKDAIDLRYAREVSAFLHSEHTEFIFDMKDVLSILQPLIYHLETYDITTIRASIGMFYICRCIHEQTNIKVLVTGEVSDELFGYKYTDFAPNAEEFQKESLKRITELYMYDVLRADRCLAANALEARVPFSDQKFVDYILSIPPKFKMNTHQMGKYLLRMAFTDDDLPHAIRFREKAAFSDAVGHSMVDGIKAYAQTYYTDEQFQILSKKYTHARPFTKEALLYREIFHTFYPKQEHLIKDFWMPNASWPHCAVNDPSARVLSNYGNSGN